MTQFLETILDISHWNGLRADLSKAAAAGYVAVIAKATEGTYSTDPTFVAHQETADTSGMLFGAYHFGTDEDGADQAAFFLSRAMPRQSDLIALDFEAADANGEGMSIEQAEAFVQRVYSALGRWPVLYGGGYLKDHLGGKPSPILSNCPLWLSEYGPRAVLPIGWKNWMLWQFSNGQTNASGLGAVPGVGVCDRNRFNGDADALMAAWPFSATTT